MTLVTGGFGLGGEPRDMGERFVVVPVDGGVAEQPEAAVSHPAPDTGGGGGGRGGGGGVVAEGDSAIEPADPNVVVPILEYNREPNKYGKT